MWEKLEKSPKGGVGGSETVTNQLFKKLGAGGQLRPGRGKKI